MTSLRKNYKNGLRNGADADATGDNSRKAEWGKE